ncbi:VCBS domain-containing protein [Roseobacteraceae bacterium S113]
MANDNSPIINNLDATAALSFMAGGDAILLDTDVTITDADEGAFDTGSVVVVSRAGGANADDVFSFVGLDGLEFNGYAYSVVGNEILIDDLFTGGGSPQVMATFSIGAGSITLTHTGIGNKNDFAQAIQAIAYQNTDSSVSSAQPITLEYALTDAGDPPRTTTQNIDVVVTPGPEITGDISVTQDDANTIEGAKVESDVLEAYDFLGSALDVSDDGLTMVVSRAGADTANPSAGEVAVFKKIDGAWVEAHVITNPDDGASDFFGLRLKLSGDGSTLIASANNGAASNAGRVHIFTLDAAGAATNRGFVEAATPTAEVRFGSNGLSILDDGSKFAVGARNESQVVVYDFDGTSATVDTSVTVAGYIFGSSPLLLDDGNKLIAGQFYSVYNGSFWQSGGHVYTRANDAASFGHTSSFFPGVVEATNDLMSVSAASDDGSVLVAGASGLDIGGDGDVGAAYVFLETSQDTYVQIGSQLTQPGGGAMNDRYPSSVAVSGDGTTIAVGGTNFDVSASEDAGAVSVYAVDASTQAVTLVATLTQAAVTTIDAPYVAELFGTSVHVSNDGSTITVGVENDVVWDPIAEEYVPGAGSVAVYERGPDGLYYDAFGTAFGPAGISAADALPHGAELIVGEIDIVNDDASPLTFETQADVAGANGFGTFSLNADGSWEFLLDTTSAAYIALDAGEAGSESFAVQDTTGAVTETVTISFEGLEDTAMLQDDNVNPSEPLVVENFDGTEATELLTFFAGLSVLQGIGFTAEGPTLESIKLPIVNDADLNTAFDYRIFLVEVVEATDPVSGAGTGNYFLGSIVGTSANQSYDGTASGDVTIAFEDAAVVPGQQYVAFIDATSLNSSLSNAAFLLPGVVDGGQFPIGAEDGFIANVSTIGAASVQEALESGIGVVVNGSNSARVEITYVERDFISEDVVTTILAADLLANDTDPDTNDNPLSIDSVSATSSLGAAVSLDMDGNVVYDPTAVAAIQALKDGETLQDTFTYTVDGETATVTLTVDGVNAAPNPVATPTENDFEDTVFTFAEATLRGPTNDEESSGSELSVVNVGNPVGGTVEQNGDGSVTFTPTANYVGAASFDYQVSDPEGNLTSVLTQNIIYDEFPDPTEVSLAVTSPAGPVGAVEQLSVIGNGGSAETAQFEALVTAQGSKIIVTDADGINAGSSIWSFIDNQGTSAHLTNVFNSGDNDGDFFSRGTLTQMADGNVLAIWVEGRKDIYTSVITLDENGGYVSNTAPALRLTAQFTDNQISVDALPSGGAIVVFDSERGPGVPTAFSFVSASGVLGVSSRLPGDNNYNTPSVVALSDTSAAVVTTTRNDDDDLVWSLSIVNSNTTYSGPFELDATYTTANGVSGYSAKHFSDVAVLSDGTIAVAVNVVDDDGEITVEVHRFDQSGNAVGTPITVVDWSGSANDGQMRPQIEAASDGGFGVAFTSEGNNSDENGIPVSDGTYFRQFNGDGTPAGDAIFLGLYGSPQMDTDADGNFVVIMNGNPTSSVPNQPFFAQTIAPVGGTDQTVAEDAPLTLDMITVSDADPGDTHVDVSATNGTIAAAQEDLDNNIAVVADGVVTFTGTPAEINAALARATFTGDPNFNGDAVISIEPATVPGGQATTTTLNVAVTPANDAPDLEIDAPTAPGGALSTELPLYSYVESNPTDAETVFADAVTVEFWVQLESGNIGGTIFEATGSGGELLRARALDDAVQFTFSATAGGAGSFFSGSTNSNGSPALADNEWYHVAMTFSPEGGNSIYVNGNVVYGFGGNTFFGMNIAINDLVVGGSTSRLSDDAFDGAIADFRIWNTEKSQADIQAGLGARVDDPAAQADLIYYLPLANSAENLAASTSDFSERTAPIGANEAVFLLNGPDGLVLDALPFAVEEDTATIVTTNVSDIDGDTAFTYSVDDGGTTGAVTNNNDGTFGYDASGAFENLAEGQTATDTFDVTVTDAGGLSDTQTVTITVRGVNDDPTIGAAANEIVNLDEDGSITFDNLVISDADDGATIAVTLFGEVRDVVYTLHQDDIDSGLAVLQDEGNAAYFVGSVADVNTALARTSFTPPADFNGETPIYVDVQDENGGFAGTSINLNIAAQPDDPDLIVNYPTAQSYNVDGVAANALISNTSNEDLGIGGGGFTIEMSFKPSDNAGDAQYLYGDTTGSASAVRAFYTAQTNNGTISVVIPAISSGIPTLHSLSITDVDNALDADGWVHFSVSVDVDPLSPLASTEVKTYLNGAPAGDETFTFINLPFVADEIISFGDHGAQNGSALEGAIGDVRVWSEVRSDAQILAGHNSPIADPAAEPTLTVYLPLNGDIENRGTGGSFIVPAPNAADNFSDDSATGLAEVATSFEVSEDSGAVTLTTSVTDPDAEETASFEIDTTGTTGDVTATPVDGHYDYDPNGQFENLAEGETATDSFVVTVTDATGLTDTETVNITIVGKNDTPVLAEGADTALSVDEDGSVLLDGISFADPDNGDTLTVVLTPNTGAFTADAADITSGFAIQNPGDSSVTLTGTVAQVNAAVARVSYAPDANFAGLTDYTMDVRDAAGAGATTGEIIEVNAINDDPEIEVLVPRSLSPTENGGAGYVSGTGTFQSGPTYTLEAWFRTSDDNAQTILHGLSGEFDAFNLRVVNGDLEFAYSVGNGLGLTTIPVGSDIADGAWHHVAVVVGGSGLPIDVDTYVDGVKTGVGFSSGLAGTLTDINVGRAVADSTTSAFKGEIADVRIWNDARSDAEVAGTYDRILDPAFESNLVAYLPLDGSAENLVTGGATFTEVSALYSNAGPEALNAPIAVSEDSSVTVDFSISDVEELPQTLAVTVDDSALSGGTATLNDGSVTFDAAGAFDHLAAGETSNETITLTVTDSFGGEDTVAVDFTVTGENDAPELQLTLEGGGLEPNLTPLTTGFGGALSWNGEHQTVLLSNGYYVNASAPSGTTRVQYEAPEGLTVSGELSLLSLNGSDTANTIVGVYDIDPVSENDSAGHFAVVYVPSNRTEIKVALVSYNEVGAAVEQTISVQSGSFVGNNVAATLNSNGELVIVATQAGGGTGTDTSSLYAGTVTFNSNTETISSVWDDTTLDVMATSPAIAQLGNGDYIVTTTFSGTTDYGPGNGPEHNAFGRQSGVVALNEDGGGFFLANDVTLSGNYGNGSVLEQVHNDAVTLSNGNVVTADVITGSTSELSQADAAATFDEEGLKIELRIWDGTNTTPTLVGTPIVVASGWTDLIGEGNGQSMPDLLALPGGGFMLAFYNTTTTALNDGSGQNAQVGTYVQEFAADGTPVTDQPVFVIDNVHPNLMLDPDGNVVLSSVDGTFSSAAHNTLLPIQLNTFTQTTPLTVDEDGSVAFAGIAITDADNGATVTVNLTVTDGAIVLVDMAADLSGATITVPAGANTLQIVGSPADVSTAIAAYGYAPTADFNGDATLTISYTDGVIAEPLTQEIAIGVTPVNDLPVAVDDGTSDISAVTVGDEMVISAAQIVANDTDVDNTAAELSVVLAQGATTAQGANLSLDGSGNVVIDRTGVSSYEALADGTTLVDSFTYSVNDGDGTSLNTATIEFTVIGINDAPTMGSSNAVAGENETISFDLTESGDDPDSNTDGSDLTYEIVGDNPNNAFSIEGTTLTFTPGTAFDDLDAFDKQVTSVQVRASDGKASSETGSFDVFLIGANDEAKFTGSFAGNAFELPVGSLSPEDGVVTGTASATDVDGDDADGFTPVTLEGTYGTLELLATGAWTYTVDESKSVVQALSSGKSETDSFTVSSTDGTETSIDITVFGANDVPTIGAIAPQSTDENTAVTLDLASLLGDVDTDDLPGALVLSAQMAVINTGSVEVNGQSITWTPGTDLDYLTAGAETQVVVNVTVTDGENTSEVRDIVIDVSGLNDEATLSGEFTGDLLEDEFADGSAITSVSGSFTSSDPDTLEDGLVALTNGTDGSEDGDYGTLTLSETGDWTYSYDPDQEAVQALGEGQKLTETFRVQSIDGTDERDLTITINGANDAPVAVADAVQMYEDQGPLVIDALDNDTDVDFGDTKTITGLGKIANGTAKIVDNKIEYTPDENFNGTEVFNYQMEDAKGVSSFGTVTVTVDAVNDAPEIVHGPRAAVFADAGDRLETQGLDGTALGDADGMTVEFWVKGADSIDASTTIAVFDSDEGSSTGLLISMDDEGIYASMGTRSVAVSLDLLGTWTHVAVRHADGGALELVVNGTQSESSSDVDWVGFDSFVIGESVSLPRFEGEIAQVRLWEEARTDQQIADAMNAPLNGDESGLLGEFDFARDDGMGAFLPASGVAGLTLVPAGINYTAADIASFSAPVSVDEDGSIVFALAPSDLDADQANGGLMAFVQFALEEGETPPGTLSYMAEGTLVESDETGSLLFFGGLAEIQFQMASITFTPEADFNGTVNFVAAISDGGSTGINPTFLEARQNPENDGLTDEDLADLIGVAADAPLDTPVLFSIVVNPVNDPATIEGDLGSVEENSFADVSGTLTATDIDNEDNKFLVQEDVETTYGDFSIDEDGNWSYTLDETNPLVDALAFGQSTQDTITVQSIDGTEKEFTMEINGMNDAPVSATIISGDDNTIAIADLTNGDFTVEVVLQETVQFGESVDILILVDGLPAFSATYTYLLDDVGGDLVFGVTGGGSDQITVSNSDFTFSLPVDSSLFTEGADITLEARMISADGMNPSDAVSDTASIDVTAPAEVDSTQTIDENPEDAFVVATFTDVDGGGSDVTHELSVNPGEAFELVDVEGTTTLRIADASAFDYEALIEETGSATLTATVVSTDEAGNATTTTHEVNLNDVNDAPVVDIEGSTVAIDNSETAITDAVDADPVAGYVSSGHVILFSDQDAGDSHVAQVAVTGSSIDVPIIGVTQCGCERGRRGQPCGQLVLQRRRSCRYRDHRRSAGRRDHRAEHRNPHQRRFPEPGRRHGCAGDRDHHGHQ